MGPYETISNLKIAKSQDGYHSKYAQNPSVS